jgi:hypothetical protein
MEVEREINREVERGRETLTRAVREQERDANKGECEN